MKRILITLCALALAAAGAAPALAAEAGRDPCRYPVSVEEYTADGAPRIKKVYQLSLGDDPGGIPTGDFERDGRLYTLLDMTRRDDIGVEVQPLTRTVTLPFKTDNMEEILGALDPVTEVVTEDGYSGTLQLDRATVKVSVDGYATRSRTISATRTYPNLSDADLSLIPKSIQDNGRTLTLDDVQWASANQTEAEGTVLRYCATAVYTGTATSQYATGYTVTADYTGEVARPGCDVVTYTLVFGSVEAPEESRPEPSQPSQDLNADAAESAPDSTEAPVDLVGLRRPIMIGGAAALLAAGGFVLFKKIKRGK